jgi:hypothetical protein
MAVEFTFIVIVWVPVHPDASVPVIVNVVLGELGTGMSITVEQTGGLAQTGLAPEMFPGFQTKLTPAGGLVISRLVTGVDAPSQTSVIPVGALKDNGVTVIATVAVCVQPKQSVLVTV